MFFLHGLVFWRLTVPNIIFYLYSRNDISSLKLWKLLVSLETEKTTTTYNFQTMVMNSFVIPHDLMRNQIGSYAYMQI